jgi:hypothetical protein
MKLKKLVSLVLSVVFISTTALGSSKSSTYLAFESYYKQITHPDRTLNFKKIEQIFRQDPEVHQNFLVLLRMLRKTQSPRVQLLFFEKEGQRFPRIQISEGKQSLFIDIHGEQERFMRMGNAYYSVEELRTPVLFLKKYFASNPNEDRQLKSDFLKQPLEITFEMWKFLTPEQRALTLAGLRSLLYDAIRVKEAFGRGKEVSQSGWFEQLLLPRAHAQEGTDCVVAGYKAKNQGGRCETSTVNGAEGCSSGQFPCNPVVFGFQQGVRPHCLDMADRSFQTATKVCHEQKAPLGNPEEIKKFLESVLKSKNKTMSEFLGANGQIKRDKFQELKNLVIDPFNSQIDSAIQACQQPNQFDPEQGSACEALETRRGQFREFLESVGASAEAGTALCPPVQPPAEGAIPPPPSAAPPPGQPPSQGTGPNPIPPAPVVRPGCGTQVPGGSSPPGSTPSSQPSGAHPSSKEPGFFGSIWQGIRSSASGIWEWMTGRGQRYILAAVLTAGVGYLVYQLQKKPNKLSSPPAKDPVVPPTTVPVIVPTTSPPSVTPSVR